MKARKAKANARHTEITDLIAERMARKHQIESYLKELRSREPLTEFRETDWLAMVDYIAVHSKNGYCQELCAKSVCRLRLNEVSQQ